MLEEKRLAEADIARERNDLSILQLDIARRESYLVTETSKLKHLRGAVCFYTILLAFYRSIQISVELCTHIESANDIHFLLLIMHHVYHRRV